MKYEFSSSWSFNQMLVVSVFVHLLLMTVILYLPKIKTPPPVEVVAWNVDLIDDPAGRLEKPNPQKVKEKGEQKEEQEASITKPVPEKPKVSAKAFQTPEKKAEVENKEPVAKPPPVKPDIPIEKPAPRKEVVVASKPVIIKPSALVKAPSLTIPKIAVTEKRPEVPKVAFSTPKISRLKPQPRTLPKPRQRTVSSHAGVVEELDQIASIQPVVREKSSALPREKMITDENFKALDNLRRSSGKVTQANIVPLPMENPLEGFDRLAMGDKVSDTRPKLVSGKDATFIRDLEFDSLSNKKRDVEELPKTKLASNRLQGHTKQKQLDAITNAQKLSSEIDAVMVESDEAYKAIANKIDKLKSSNIDVSVDIKPSASDLLKDHVSLHQEEKQKEFKSEIRETSTNLQNEKLAAKPVSPDSKTLVEKITNQNKSAIAPRKTVVGETAVPASRPKVASIAPQKKFGTPKPSDSIKGSSVPNAPPKDDKKSAEVLSLYAGFIREKVMSNWKNPLGAEHKQVLVSFYLYPGGNVGKPYVEKSSGNPQLDSLALRAIADSEPFPKFPSELTQPNLHISIHFKYVYLQD